MLDSVNASRRVVCDQCAIRAQIDAIARSPKWSQLGGPLPGHAAGRWVGHRLQMAFSMFGARSGPVTCGPGWPVPDRQTRNEDQPFLTRSESWGRGESPVAAYAHGSKLSRQGRPLLTFPRADPFFWILDCPLHFPDASIWGIRLDVTVPASGEGPQAKSGTFRDLGAAYRLPVPDETGGAGHNALKSNNLKSETHGSSSSSMSAWCAISRSTRRQVQLTRLFGMVMEPGPTQVS